MKQEEAIRRAPVPEARMRLQEATAKTNNPTPISTSSSSFKAPRKQVQPVRAAQKTYDPAKDPFATDEPPGAVSVDARRKIVEPASNNPFDEEDEDVKEAADRKELDSNLNPFE